MALSLKMNLLKIRIAGSSYLDFVYSIRPDHSIDKQMFHKQIDKIINPWYSKSKIQCKSCLKNSTGIE